MTPALVFTGLGTLAAMASSCFFWLCGGVLGNDLQPGTLAMLVLATVVYVAAAHIALWAAWMSPAPPRMFAGVLLVAVTTSLPFIFDVIAYDLRH
jgi:hypothetical protein